jgi:hypothetical protein
MWTWELLKTVFWASLLENHFQLEMASHCPSFWALSWSQGHITAWLLTASSALRYEDLANDFLWWGTESRVFLSWVCYPIYRELSQVH